MIADTDDSLSPKGVGFLASDDDDDYVDTDVDTDEAVSVSDDHYSPPLIPKLTVASMTTAPVTVNRLNIRNSAFSLKDDDEGIPQTETSDLSELSDNKRQKTSGDTPVKTSGDTPGKKVV